MGRLAVSRLRTHKVRELKGNCFFVVGPLGCLQLQAQLVEFDGHKLDGHIAIKGFGICPTRDTIPVCKLLIDRKKSIEFIVIDVSVLKSTGIDNAPYTIKYFRPIFFMLPNAYGI